MVIITITIITIAVAIAITIIIILSKCLDMQYVLFLTCFSGDLFQHVHQMMVKTGKWSAKRKSNINLQCYSKQQTIC